MEKQTDENEKLIPVIQRYSTTEMAPFFRVCPRQVSREFSEISPHCYEANNLIIKDEDSKPPILTLSFADLFIVLNYLFNYKSVDSGKIIKANYNIS